MTRIALASALLIAGPALAHSTSTVHLHEVNVLSLIMGLALIAAGIGAAALVRVRSK